MGRHQDQSSQQRTATSRSTVSSQSESKPSPRAAVKKEKQSTPEIIEDDFKRQVTISTQESKQSMSTVHSPLRKGVTKIAEELYVDDFETLDDDEPPPSYRQLFPSRQEDKAFSSKFAGSPEGFPAKSEAKEARAIAETPQERRERLALIRQQTFQRVRQRQQEESLKKR